MSSKSIPWLELDNHIDKSSVAGLRRERRENLLKTEKEILADKILSLESQLYDLQERYETTKKELSDIHWQVNPGQGMRGTPYTG